ncbi:hypothetical protein KPA96_19405 [Burkholderia cenocepacia]|uniref:surface-adhesin E family protein n=1 Tax=Burkholderia cenocepacia TaxID=95486 RepID=UPI00286452DA|nr:surface-adhesin E family protein [Burkholderia cenocepacia]MDR8077825.1 hypothetical protein [Burkholderia cenocepacia]
MKNWVANTIAICVIALTQPALAADWRELTAVRADGVMFQLDYNSISQARGYRKAWLLTSYDEPQPGNAATKFRPYQSLISQDFYDCANRQSTVGKVVFYEKAHAGGQTVGSVDISSPFKKLSEVVPSSTGEGVLETVCSLKRLGNHPAKATM